MSETQAPVAQDTSETIMEKFSQRLTAQKEQEKTDAGKSNGIANIKPETTEVKDEDPLKAPESKDEHGDIIEAKKVVDTTVPNAKMDPVEVKDKKSEKVDEKQWWEETQEEKDAPKKGSKEERDKEISGYQQKVKEYEDIMQDTEISELIKAKKNGKNLLDFINEVKPVDYDKMAPDQLFEIKLKNLGATDEEIKEAIDEFKTMPKWKQSEEVVSLKDGLKREQGDRLKKFSSSAELHKKRHDEIVQKAKNDLDGELATLLDKDYYGMKITPEIAENLKDAVYNEISVPAADGTIDVKKSLMLAAWLRFSKQIVQANVNKAKSAKANEIFQEITRPSANNVEDKRPPSSEGDRFAEAKKSYLKDREGITKN